MEQFNLEKWLQDKSRKVVTRDGKDVEIVYTNSPVPHHPIVGFIDKSIYTWTIDGKLIYGKEEQDEKDIFFADEEEGLIEFEKAMIQFSHERNSLIQFEHTTEEINAHLYLYSEKLLDLARKEILKNFPKWKKDNNNLSSTFYRLDNRGGGDILLCRKGYAISIKELLNLPKEE